MHKKYHEKFKILDILAVTTKAHEKKHPVPVPGKNKNFLGFQNSYLKTSFSYDACFSEWPLEANCYKTADFKKWYNRLENAVGDKNLLFNFWCDKHQDSINMFIEQFKAVFNELAEAKDVDTLPD